MSSRAGGDWVRFVIHAFREVRRVGVGGDPAARRWLGGNPNAITFVVCLSPQPFGNGQRFDFQVCPKCFLTSPAVELAMVSAAKRHSKFIADLQAQSPALGETDVMSIARVLCADDTRLLCAKLAVILV